MRIFLLLLVPLLALHAATPDEIASSLERPHHPCYSNLEPFTHLLGDYHNPAKGARFSSFSSKYPDRLEDLQAAARAARKPEIAIPLYLELWVRAFYFENEKMKAYACYGLGKHHAGIENFDLALFYLNDLEETKFTIDMKAMTYYRKACALRAIGGMVNCKAALRELKEAEKYAKENPDVMKKVQEAINGCQLIVDEKETTQCYCQVS